MTYKDIERIAATLDEHDEDGEIRLPYSWALLFLYANHITFLDALADNGHAHRELNDIVDWIEHGDPETREEAE